MAAYTSALSLFCSGPGIDGSLSVQRPKNDCTTRYRSAGRHTDWGTQKGESSPDRQRYRRHRPSVSPHMSMEAYGGLDMPVVL